MEYALDEPQDGIGSILKKIVVQVITPTESISGFFIRPDIIATVSYDLGREDKRLVKIHHDFCKYSILSCNVVGELGIVLLKVSVQGNSPLSYDDFVSLFGSQADCQAEDRLVICGYSLISESEKLIQGRCAGGDTGHFITFRASDIEPEFRGALIFNMKTKRITGIVSDIKRENLHAISKASGGTGVMLPDFNVSSMMGGDCNEFIPVYSYNFPEDGSSSFVGREIELKQLLEFLLPSYRQHLIVINGIDGIGKTALAVQVSLILEKMSKGYPFKSTVFISANKKSTLDLLLESILTSLNQRTKDFKFSNLRDFVNLLLSQEKSLLIIDGLEYISRTNFKEILDFLDNLPSPTKAIITTRDQALVHSHITLGPLSDGERQQLIKSEIKARGISMKLDDIERIANFSEGLPGIILSSIDSYASAQVG